MIVPFKKTYVYAGFGSASGLVRFEDRTLEIEYRTIDEIINFFKSDTRQIALKLSDIDSVDIKRGWFSYKLFIDLRSMKSLDRFPAVKGNRITLRISRSNSEKLKNLKSTLALAISEHNLQQLDIDIDQDEYESIRTKDPVIISKNHYSDKSESDTDGRLPNALERRDQKNIG